jgi:hypothetical protein
MHMPQDAPIPQVAVQAPPAPAPVTLRPGQRVNVVTPGVNGTPGTPAPIMTSRDVAALKARGRELSNQLNSADGRRKELQRTLQSAEGASKAGLEQRLAVLDNRIARIELDIEENGRALASLPAQRVSGAQEPGFRVQTRNEKIADAAQPIIIVFTLFVLAPMAFSISRMFWRRSSALPVAGMPAEAAQRLERMEQAMDAIAIEVERVSEGQRFVTRLLAEGRGGQQLAGGQPAMEPVPIGMNQGVGTSR